MEDIEIVLPISINRFYLKDSVSIVKRLNECLRGRVRNINWGSLLTDTSEPMLAAAALVSVGWLIAISKHVNKANKENIIFTNQFERQANTTHLLLMR